MHGNQYGTSLEAAGAVAAEGRCCVLDIDVQGARAVRASGLPAIFVFVAPPSQEELERRIRNRATETEEAIVTRISAAREELQRWGRARDIAPLRKPDGPQRPPLGMDTGRSWHPG